MAYTWIQLQWRRNDETFDRTVKYEIYRADHSVVLDPMRTWSPEEDILHYTKIMDVAQPPAGVSVLVSDSPDNLRANDIQKLTPPGGYIGPMPWDFSKPAKPTLSIVADNANNRARVWWPAVLVKPGNTPWYYRIRAIDDSGDPSDLSHELSGILQADMSPVPYQLAYSSNGYDWTWLDRVADLEYFQTGVDVNAPYPAFNGAAQGIKTGPSSGKVALSWFNPTADIGSPSWYFKLRIWDQASVQFPGRPDNYSEESEVAQPVEVIGGITDGVGGVEVRYVNDPAEKTNVQVTLNGTTPSSAGDSLLIAGTVLVRNSFSQSLYFNGVDYTVDYDGGRITRIEGGGIYDGEPVLVSYRYNARTPPTDASPVLAPYDGTKFTGYGVQDMVEHTGLPEMDAYSYRIRVKDNLGNWSPPIYVHATIGDFTPPPDPENLSVDPL